MLILKCLEAIVTNWVQEQGRSVDTVASMENPVTHAHEGLMLVNINMVNDSTPFSEPGGGARKYSSISWHYITNSGLNTD